MSETYTSTVVAPAQIALGAVSGVVVAIILIALNSALWPFAIIAFLVAVGVGAYLSVVSLTITPGRITLGQGRGEREQRVLYAAELAESSSRTLTWPQCFGVGMPSADRSTRLSVRPGPALLLMTLEDELIVVSTPDPQAALRALSPVVEPLPPRPPRATKPHPRPRAGG